MTGPLNCGKSQNLRVNKAKSQAFGAWLAMFNDESINWLTER
jgi:hypothetical protein